MEEVAHDAVARGPVVAMAGVMVGTEAGGAERGFTALGAEAHDRKPRRPTDLSIAALPGFGLDLTHVLVHGGPGDSRPPTRSGLRCLQGPCGSGQAVDRSPSRDRHPAAAKPVRPAAGRRRRARPDGVLAPAIRVVPDRQLPRLGRPYRWSRLSARRARD